MKVQIGSKKSAPSLTFSLDTVLIYLKKGGLKADSVVG